jgi:N-acetylglucosaminyl-diphospho-decaprenol L-rhamnosyltransferase
MFPRSKRIAGYYMGHLDNDQVNEVEVLSGAFMFVRKVVLDRTGGFDERFFMYAEDIDLSYRITREGYINFYFPETTIIHYKGESTKKGFKYIRQFYKAMSQFVKKHFHSRGSRLFATTLDLAIWLRAAVELIISRTNRKSAKDSDEKQTIITNNGTSVKELIRYIEYHPGPKYFIKITTDDASSLPL